MSNSSQNLPSLFYERAGQNGDRPLFFIKKPDPAARDKEAWQGWSWNRVAAEAEALTATLRRLGVGAGDRVAIVSENRPEWAIADIAIMAIGAISVSVYTTNSPEDHRHIFSDCGAAVAIISSLELCERVVAGVTGGVTGGHLSDVIVMENGISKAGSSAALKKSAIRFMLWAEAVAAEIPRFADRHWHQLAKQLRQSIPPDSLAQITYSSGTGGAPRGIMLSHRNILSNVLAAEALITPVICRSWFRRVPRIFLSFLPLSHCYEHTAGLWLPIQMSAQVYYAESVGTIAANLLEVRPTIMTLVPRLFEMLYGRLTLALDKKSVLQKRLFFKAIEVSNIKTRGRLSLRDRIADPLLGLLIRRRIKRVFGGRIRALVSGGAALSTELAEYFYGLGIPVCQGYGQTEAAPVISCNSPLAPRLHTVGKPLQGVTVKIADDGEILVKGDNVMVGYWNNPTATAETLDNGWLRTGDIGHLDSDGYLVITDRKRDIIKLSGGDTLSPARIEGRLGLEPEIAQVMVFASKVSGAFVAALIVPASPKFNEDQIRAAIDRANRDLSPPEKVRKFILTDQAFTIDNGLMTPTMKLRRHLITRTFAAEMGRI
ncbi:MAG: AMP-dependent synthetase/ligase [Candidatus Pacebacteria bacterium]|nr:AMP-dependent synthetase/ligase [Candidatus Paceibacterota bacterium]